jgi:hypothetical protein
MHIKLPGTSVSNTEVIQDLILAWMFVNELLVHVNGVRQINKFCTY